MNKRLLSFIGVSSFVVILICSISVLIIYPKATEKWTSQTQTVDAQTLNTQTAANATEEYDASLTATVQAMEIVANATKLVSATQTESARPTATSPVSIDCKADVIIETSLATIPGGGWLDNVKATKSMAVSVLYSLDDGGWYPVNLNSNQYGWLPAKNLKFDDPSCAKHDSLTHALTLINPKLFVNDTTQTIVIEDMFNSNAYHWMTVQQPQVLVDRKPDENFGNDYQLVFDAYSDKNQITSSVLTGIANPSVVLSLSRKNADDDSYVGVRFDSSSTSDESLEIHVLGGNCTVQVFENNLKTADQIIPGEDKACSRGSEDSLEFKVSQQWLEVRINGQGPYKISLSKDYGIGNLSLIARHTKVRLSFIVVTTPR